MLVNYEALNAKIRSKENLAKFLKYLDLILTVFAYIFYPLLVIYVFIFKYEDLLKAVLTPALSLLAVSILRRIVNAPRPCEKYPALVPLTKRKKSGESFPSRHSFSIFIIAVTALYFNLILGIVLLFFGIILAVNRVLMGVHFFKDVIVGGALGLIFGTIGMFLI